jgi:hypothetical protein
MSVTLAVAEPAALPDARRRSRERLTCWWCAAVCLSAFGPYIGGMRMEQVTVLASAAVILVIGWPRMMAARDVPSPWPLIILAGICCVTLIGTVSRPFDPNFLGAQPVTHGLSYFVLPLALVVITWYWTLSASPSRLAVTAAKVTAAASAASGVIAVAQLVAGNVTVLGFLPQFWSAGATSSGAVRTASDGRFDGIFAQPAEAGLVEGLALLCVIFLWQRGSRRPVLLGAAAAAITAGGLLSVSKVFLLGALPLAALMVLRGPARANAAAVTACAVAAFWLADRAGVLPAWQSTGGALSRRLGAPSVTVWTGGRYGSGSSLGPAVADVLHGSPWYGFGGGGLGVAYDSLWLELLAIAGVAGVALTAALLAVLVWRWVRLRPVLNSPERRLAGMSLALAAGASLGVPSLTENVAVTVLWLILGLLLCAQPLPRRGGSRAEGDECCLGTASSDT